MGAAAEKKQKRAMMSQYQMQKEISVHSNMVTYVSMAALISLCPAFVLVLERTSLLLQVACYIDLIGGSSYSLVHNDNSCLLRIQANQRKWAKKIQSEWTILEKNLPDTIFVIKLGLLVMQAVTKDWGSSFVYLIRLELLAARNLFSAKLNGSSDPYAIIECGTQKRFSSMVPNSRNPVWGEEFDFYADDLPVQTGDELVVDGGIVRFEALEKVGDPGMLLPCANLTVWRNGAMVREKNARLPTISSKDWVDSDFGISEGVDFISISFVKTSEVIKHLRTYYTERHEFVFDVVLNQ